jgi:hypothetical protein
MKKVLFLGMALVLSAACNNPSKIMGENAPSIATIKDGLTVVEESLVEDSLKIVMQLSAIAEDLQIVKLDTAKHAFVPPVAAYISENYILTSSWQNEPFKLFSKTGKFLTNIGSKGRGPGEYGNVYDVQIDEANNRIYLLPWTSDKILVYDLTGKILEPIRFAPMQDGKPVMSPKGVFRVDAANQTLTVATLPWEGIPYIVWSQKIENDTAEIGRAHV